MKDDIRGAPLPRSDHVPHLTQQVTVRDHHAWNDGTEVNMAVRKCVISDNETSKKESKLLWK